MSDVGDRAEAERLLSASAVRDAANAMFRLAQANDLPQWRMDLSRMAAAASEVTASLTSAT